MADNHRDVVAVRDRCAIDPFDVQSRVITVSAKIPDRAGPTSELTFIRSDRKATLKIPLSYKIKPTSD